MSAFLKLRELHLGKSVSKARGAGQPAGTCFYRAKPMDLLSLCFLLTLLFFIILFYILPAFGLAIFLDHVLSRWFL